MKTVDDYNFKDKKALIRVDFNVPLDDERKVTDTSRIEATKSTIVKVLEDGGAAVLISHLGRPKGKVDPRLSFSHICTAVSETIGVQVKFVEDCVGEVAEKAVAALKNGEVLLLENLRFHPEEEQGDEAFAQALAQYGDIYVNDAFAATHRAHASITTVTHYFPGKKCLGYLLAKEIKAIERILKTGEKPMTVILGGAKVSTKIPIIEHILDKVDHLIIGGGMTYTFIKAQGGQIGSSICEEDKMDLALDILKHAEEKGVQVHLPVDVVAADAFDTNAHTQIVPVHKIPEGWQGLDVGPKTLEQFEQIIIHSKTILWNGPVGVFEMENFAKGTIALGNCIVKATQEGAFSLVGGGDSVAAVKKFGFEDKVSYVSTGGGAMLESLEGKTLPGIAAILQ